jgi:uncharacterized protein YbaA (DUF1428 family)
MKYVDGFLLPVPKKKLKDYAAMAKKAGRVWKAHGALDYKEAVGDDMKVKFGLPFPRVVKPKAGETIVFSFIVYKSRAHRDKVNAKVMKDPRLNAMMVGKDMPFDVKRMCYGGFRVLVDA